MGLNNPTAFNSFHLLKGQVTLRSGPVSILSFIHPYSLVTIALTIIMILVTSPNAVLLPLQVLSVR